MIHPESHSTRLPNGFQRWDRVAQETRPVGWSGLFERGNEMPFVLFSREEIKQRAADLKRLEELEAWLKASYRSIRLQTHAGSKGATVDIPLHCPGDGRNKYEADAIRNAVEAAIRRLADSYKVRCGLDKDRPSNESDDWEEDDD